MANDRMTTGTNRLLKQEKQLRAMAVNLARSVLDADAVASQGRVSDYKTVRTLSPLLQQMGQIGMAMDMQIQFHDAAAQAVDSTQGLERSIVAAGPGDKSGN